MKCQKCAYENPDDAVVCGLCGELMRTAPTAAPEPAIEVQPRERVGLFQRPYVCLAIGLAVFPVAKLLWFPNYIFNFLTTLVHECGHAACAWFVGMPSIPAVSIAGGGVTTWQEQNWQIAVLVWIGLGALAWKARRAKAFFIPLAVLAAAYPAIAFTKLGLALAIFGGILFEVGGAAACFVACLGAHLERPFERPLYALWGWWMVLNRICESWLILTDASYRLQHRVIESGLAEGIPSDLTQFTLQLNVSPRPVLYLILALCLLALPISIGIARWMRGRD